MNTTTHSPASASVAALVRDVTVPGSHLSVAELVSGVHFDDGVLDVYLRAPEGGLSHFRELSEEIRERLHDLPDVRRVTVQAVLAVH